jgi:subtilisin family serine protease
LSQKGDNKLVHLPGPVSVDVAAPGVSVLGLGIGGSYVYMTGTSMATPHVTALAAIVLGK